jgi:hypothetical protein
MCAEGPTPHFYYDVPRGRSRALLLYFHLRGSRDGRHRVPRSQSRLTFVHRLASQPPTRSQPLRTKTRQRSIILSPSAVSAKFFQIDRVLLTHCPSSPIRQLPFTTATIHGRGWSILRKPPMGGTNNRVHQRRISGVGRFFPRVHLNIAGSWEGKSNDARRAFPWLKLKSLHATMDGLVLLMPLSQRPCGAVPPPPVTSSGILLLSHTVAIPSSGSCCAALLLLLPPGLDREDVLGLGSSQVGLFPLLCNRVSPLYVQSKANFPDYEGGGGCGVSGRVPVQPIGICCL